MKRIRIPAEDPEVVRKRDGVDREHIGRRSIPSKELNRDETEAARPRKTRSE